MAKVLSAAEVMKLPHLKKLKTVPVVIEEKVPFGSWNKGTILKWVGSDFAYSFYKDMQRHAERGHTWYTYGKTARVWDTMPTAEELQGAEWDG